MFALQPPVDDLSTSRGVVLSRAATILRSIETQPLTGGCLGRERYRGTPIAIVQYRAREKSEKCTGEEFSFGRRNTSLSVFCCLLSSSPLLGNSFQFLYQDSKRCAVFSSARSHLVCSSCKQSVLNNRHSFGERNSMQARRTLMRSRDLIFPEANAALERLK